MLIGRRAFSPAQVGERDRPFAIEQLADGMGGSGFPTETWTTLAAREMMRRLDTLGGEHFSANQLSAQMYTQLEMGYRPDMDPELLDVPKTRRLRAEGRVYDIISASTVGRRASIEIVALSKAG